MKGKEAGQLVVLVPSTSKIKRLSGKVTEWRDTMEKSGIERGDTPKGDYARVTAEVWNKKAW